MYPNVTIIHRNGEINAMDNADFRAAVKATGRNQVIIGGIVTDVSRLFRETPEYVTLNARTTTGLHNVRRPIAP